MLFRIKNITSCLTLQPVLSVRCFGDWMTFCITFDGFYRTHTKEVTSRTTFPHGRVYFVLS